MIKWLKQLFHKHILFRHPDLKFGTDTVRLTFCADCPFKTWNYQSGVMTFTAGNYTGTLSTSKSED